MNKPAQKPNCPHFSSGPCAKRPGWSVDVLKGAFVARSHRHADGKARLKKVIDLHRETLGIPADYKIAIVPASDTGAMEMAMWSLLGARGVDVFAWESFSKEWLTDITKQLKLPDVNVYDVDYGQLPDLSKANPANDCVFVWNGTTGGVVVPNHDWIKTDRHGLTICDATSAVYAYDMPWAKLDVTTWSWQKVVGGEAAHGMLVLSPRAVERLKTYKPAWPLPKIFRLTSKSEVTEAVFEGETINTPSMLAVEDCIDTMTWVKSLGGWQATRARCLANAKALEAWVQKTPWVDYLCTVPEARSITSVCLKITGPEFVARSPEDQEKLLKAMTKTLEKEGVAFDIAGHRHAPLGLRIWCGATVETKDIEALGPWLDWAYHETMG